ncbi:MFS transporter [Pseudarthrobacter sp. NPDC058119]|uniref:MFS transporter n=1 Tax=Pseudarthrobacter sp. NPDC058119 TaxID=3346348 RepID=UPI0036DDF08E
MQTFASPTQPPTESTPGEDGAPNGLSPRLEVKTPAYRRYVGAYGLAYLGIALLWGAVLSILLPLQVQGIEATRVLGPDVNLDALNALETKVETGELVPTAEQSGQLDLLAQFNSARASSLSLVTSVGVLLSMILQPIIGALSDRTRSRWGRRAPYVASGAIGGAAAMCLMPVASNIALLVIVWSLLQLFGNLAQGPLIATVADRVPQERLGTVSAIGGLITYGAAIFGAVVAGVLFNMVGLASYYPFAIALVMLALMFPLIARDHSSVGSQFPPLRLTSLLASFVSALRDRDYRWAWASKVLLWAGLGISGTYGIYMLQSYIHPSLPTSQAAQIAPLLQIVALPGTLIAMAVVGRLSDRLRRRKPFVIAAAAVVAVGFLVPWVWPSLPAMFIQAALSGIGLGAFLVVDQALFIDLLPDPTAAGRDLGMSGLGQNLGQAVGPLIAGLVVTVSAGAYGPVWPAGFIIVLLAALLVLPIRRVR